MDPEIEELLSLFRRDLGELRREILTFEQGERLFQTPAGVQNSVGTLGLHLAGNLQHHIGATLGETGYVRDRPAEFSRRCSAAEILAELDAALADIESILPGLTPAQLFSPFPVEIEGRTIPTRIFLWRLAVHLAYHLGQAVTVRRALDT